MFRASDGTEFSSREAWREYEMQRYRFRGIEGETLVKRPGEVDGQNFTLEDLSNCTVALCDHSDQVTADNIRDSRLLVAASSASVFLRDCTNCEVTVACKQLRTRDCTNCVIHLYSKTEPIIETSSNMLFGNFNAAYEGHAVHLLRAHLLPGHNLWFAVFDFNDQRKTGANWSLIEGETEATMELWRPLDDDAVLAIPISQRGAVPVPSAHGDTEGRGPSQEGAAGGAGSMMSFTLGTSLEDASKAMQLPTPSTQISAEQESGKVPPIGSRPTGVVGWNQERADAAAALRRGDRGAKARTEDRPTVESRPAPDSTTAATGKSQESGKVGWDPERARKARLRREAAAKAEQSQSEAALQSESKSAPLGIGWDEKRAAAARARRESRNASSKPSAAEVKQKEPGQEAPGAQSGQVRGRKAKDAVLHLKAVILYALERGVDVQKWFHVDPDDDTEQTEPWRLILTQHDFQSRLEGLGAGLSAGQPTEIRDLVSLAVSPESVEASIAASRAVSGGDGLDADYIDVGALLEVLGIPREAEDVAQGDSSKNTGRGEATSSKMDGAPNGQAKEVESDVVDREIRRAAIRVRRLTAETEQRVRRAFRQGDVFHRLIKQLEEASVHTAQRQARLSGSNIGSYSLNSNQILDAFQSCKVKMSKAAALILIRQSLQLEQADETPSYVPWVIFKDYLLTLRYKHKINREEWEREKEGEAEMKQRIMHLAFQRALHGLTPDMLSEAPMEADENLTLRQRRELNAKAAKYQMTESEIDECIARFEIVPKDLVEAEARHLARRYLDSGEGRRAIKVELLKLSTDSASDAASRAAVRKRVFNDGLQHVLRLEEDSAFVSKFLFNKFRDGVAKADVECKGVKFEEWLRRRADDRLQRLSKQKEWQRRKAYLRKKRLDELSKVALAKELERSLSETLFDKATQEIKEPMQVHTATRRGLNIEAALVQLRKSAIHDPSLTSPETNLSSKDNNERSNDLPRPKPSAEPDGEHVDTLYQTAEEVAASHASGLITRESFDKVLHTAIFSLLADKNVAPRARVLSSVEDRANRAWRRKQKAPESAEDDSKHKKRDLETTNAIATLTKLFVPESEVTQRAREEAERAASTAREDRKEWLRQKRAKERLVLKKKREAEIKKGEEAKKRKKAAKLAYRRWKRLQRQGKYYSKDKHRAVARQSTAPPIVEPDEKDWVNNNVNADDDAPEETIFESGYRRLREAERAAAARKEANKTRRARSKSANEAGSDSQRDTGSDNLSSTAPSTNLPGAFDETSGTAGSEAGEADVASALYSLIEIRTRDLMKDTPSAGSVSEDLHGEPSEEIDEMEAMGLAGDRAGSLRDQLDRIVEKQGKELDEGGIYELLGSFDSSLAVSQSFNEATGEFGDDFEQHINVGDEAEAEYDTKEKEAGDDDGDD